MTDAGSTGTGDRSPEQRYGPSSGTAIGVTGLVCCALVLALILADPLTTTSVRVGLATLVLGVLVWAFLLRPRIIVEAGGSTLVLRNPLLSWRIPLAAVLVVGVKTVTTVKTADRRFDAVAVGYPLRAVVRGRAGGADRGPVLSTFGIPGTRLPAAPADRRQSMPRPGEQDEQTLMPDRILAAADRARVRGLPEEPIERRYAVVELTLLGLLALAMAATFFG